MWMLDVAKPIYLQYLDLYATDMNEDGLLGIRESHIGSEPPDSGGERAKLSL